MYQQRMLNLRKHYPSSIKQYTPLKEYKNPALLNGYQWEQKPLEQRPWMEIAYGPTNTIVVAGNNSWSYSIDNGETWSPTVDLKPSTGPETYSALTYGDRGWILIENETYAPKWASQNFYTSNNVLTGWTINTLQHPFSGCFWTDVLYSKHHNRYIAVGKLNTVYDINNNVVYSYLTNSNYVGLSGLVCMYSSDGVNWLSGNFATTPNPIVGYAAIEEATKMANSRLIGTGGGGHTKMGYSDNGGMTWNRSNYNMNQEDVTKRVNLLSNSEWKDVAYGTSSSLPLSGRLVACNGNTTNSFQFAYSDDGINWYNSNYNGIAKKGWANVVFGNGLFVAVSNNGGWQAVSKNGTDWEVFNNMPNTGLYMDMTTINKKFASIIHNVPNSIVLADFK